LHFAAAMQLLVTQPQDRSAVLLINCAKLNNRNKSLEYQISVLLRDSLLSILPFSASETIVWVDVAIVFAVRATPRMQIGFDCVY